jgi:hypothetical protein
VLGAREDITRLMTLESGKPLAESRSEFDNGCAHRAGAAVGLMLLLQGCSQDLLAPAGISGRHKPCAARPSLV